MIQRPAEEQFARFQRTGEPDCLAAVFDAAAPRLLRVALHLAGDPGEAEDLVQATFVTAIEKASEHRAGEPLLPWLGGILARHAAHAGRQNARRPVPERLRRPDPSDPVSEAEHRELIAALRGAVQRVPEGYRRILLLRLQHGLAPAEIAEIVDLPPGTVRMRLHRGLERLRRALPSGLSLASFGVALPGPSRGLAAVRAHVLSLVPARAAVLIGGLVMVKKLAVAAAVAALIALGWQVFGIPRGAAPPEAPTLPVAEAERAPAPRARGESDGAMARRPLVPAPAPPVAAATGSLRLVVVHRDGRPARHVAAHLHPRDGTDGVLGERTVRVDEQGVAIAGGLPPGSVQVMVDRDRSEPERLAVIEAGRQTTVRVVLEPGHRVSGTVVDAAGAPVPFADVWVLRQLRGHPSAVVRQADATGGFALEDLQSATFVGASAPGHAPSLLRPAYRGSSDEVELTLALRGPAARLRGTVVGAGEAPVAGARVRLAVGKLDLAEDGSYAFGWPARATDTGADGGFELDGLAPGAVELTVRAPGHAPSTRHVELAAARTEEVVLRLAEGASLGGRVTDAGGAPIAGATVEVYGFGDYQRSSAQSAGDGGYELSCVPGERIDAEVRAEGFEPARRTLYPEPGEALRWDAVLREPTWWRARLVDGAGAPLAGWLAHWVGGAGAGTTSDARGRLRLPLGRGEEKALALRPPEQPSWLRCDWLGSARWSEEEAVVTVPPAVMPSAAIRGVVRAAGEGRAVRAGIAVEQLAVLAHAQAAGWFEVDAETGAFHVGPLAAGTYRLKLLGLGPTRQLGDLGTHTVGPGDQRDLGTVPLPEPGTLALSARRADGQPLEGASVHFFREGDGRELSGPGALNAEGMLRRPFPPGEYALALLSDNASWARRAFAVRPGEATEIALELQPAARRLIRFPAREPAGWERVRHVTFTLRDAAGGELHRDSYDPREDHPYRYAPALARGSYELTMELDDGRRFQGTFRVESVRPSAEPIVVDVTAVR